jgi:biopolymer transport protein ExbD
MSSGPKQKRKRVNIVTDMTPMVDIGFLLVIFFMSTYHARPPETVTVDLPFSRSPFKVPESDVMIITILPPARAVALAESINPSEMLYDLSRYQLPVEQGGLGLRPTLAVERIAHEIKTTERIRKAVQEAATLTEEQLRARADSLIVWWNLGRESSQPLKFDLIGQMIIQQRIRNPRLRLVIKADQDVESGYILRLMETLQDPAVNMLRFSMMTMLEAGGSAILVPKKGGG